MSRRTSRNEYRRSQLVIAAVYLLLVGLLTIATASASAQTAERSSASKHYSDGGRTGTGEAVETLDQYAELETQGERVASGRAQPSGKAGDTPATASAKANDFWIYEADVILFGDDDNDGYFYGIDLLFDADTVYSSAYVYAVLYLSFEGGPWNEYTITEDFLIEGARADDEYVVVTELQSGYPTGDYDILIELYDADTGLFLTDFGPESSSALSLLPLEDFNRDAPTFDRPVTTSRGSGGGATGFLALVLLCGVLFTRVARRPRPGAPCA